jgi:hypothetical protein
MAVQLQTLTSRLAEAQCQLELHHQVDVDRESSAAAAVVASAAAQREFLSRFADSASRVVTAAVSLTPHCCELRAVREVNQLHRSFALFIVLLYDFFCSVYLQ